MTELSDWAVEVKGGAKNDSRFQNLSLRGKGGMSPIPTGFLFGEEWGVESKVDEFNFSLV